jgi:hypothetical protein
VLVASSRPIHPTMTCLKNTKPSNAIENGLTSQLKNSVTGNTLRPVHDRESRTRRSPATATSRCSRSSAASRSPTRARPSRRARALDGVRSPVRRVPTRRSRTPQRRALRRSPRRVCWCGTRRKE